MADPHKPRIPDDAADAADADVPAFASPPCLMHEMDQAYFGALPADELVGLLNELLEAERAGVAVCTAFAAEATAPSVREALRETRLDEARFCAMLHRHIVRLGGAPSKATGAFAEKALAVTGEAERLAFLDRGQGWVAKRLRDALPGIADAALHADLADMLAAHERNIARCEESAGRREG